MEAYLEGSRLSDRYRLEARLATGATAVVWRAVDEMLGRAVAVKALHPHLADDFDLASRFADEARLAATVTHPALVSIYDTIVGPPPAIVMELIDGPDMRRRLDAGPCSIAEVLSLGWVVADGLDVAHRAGLVHRDVKPANIICTSSGRPKLGDFGIATAAAGDRTATGLVLGTAKYLAPEQVQGGQIGPHTDVYALCVVLYEALCGRPPFERVGDLPTAMARLEEAPPLLRSFRAEIPTEVESIVLRGLARLPGSRWPSAAALRDALAAEARHLGLELVSISLVPLGSAPATQAASTGRWAADATPTSAGTGPTGPTPTSTRTGPAGNELTGPRGRDPSTAGITPRRRPRRRMLRRALVLLSFAAVAALGWLLVSDATPVTDLFSGGSAGADPIVASAAAFDPEGTGPPGEHDELAGHSVDGDATTEWHTELYDDRQMGAKRGVGLVIDLVEPALVSEVTVASDGEDWSAEVYVSDARPDSLDQWGSPLAAGGGLGPLATMRPGGEGRSVLVWITDLGATGPPFRLAVFEVTIS